MFLCRCLDFFSAKSQTVEGAELKASIGKCAAGRRPLLNLYSTCIQPAFISITGQVNEIPVHNRAR